MKTFVARYFSKLRDKLSTKKVSGDYLCAVFSLILLPFITQCSFTGDWIPVAVPDEPLTLQNVRLKTPAAISPLFQLTTPEAIAPEIEEAGLPAHHGSSNQVGHTPEFSSQRTADNTPFASVTVAVTVTLTTTENVTATNSPTATWTPVTVWPTWTSAPTRTHSLSPTPTRTVAPSTQPPPAPTATREPTETTNPDTDPPPGPSPTFTTAPSNTPVSTNTPNAASCNPSGNSSYEAMLIGLINDARQAQGLHPLVQQSQLTAAARVHSNDMACNDFISHTGSDGSSPADRVSAQGYSYSWVGENIFAGNSSPQTAFDWWMDSEPHRNNILHSNYTEIGIGYSALEGSRYRSHYTAVFARPR